MKYIIEGPMRLQRVLKPDAFRHLNSFNQWQLDRPLAFYTEVLKEEEEWLLRGDLDASGFSAMLESIKLLRDVDPGLSLAQAKAAVVKMLEEQRLDGRQYVFRRCL